MTITTTIIKRSIFGDMRVVHGKSVLSGSTNTGDVVTGLNRVDSFTMIPVGTTAKATCINETLPLSSGNVTCYTEDNDMTFYWTAMGG